MSNEKSLMKNINFKKGKWDIFLNIIKQKKKNPSN